MTRQKRRQVPCDADRAHARATATVRNCKRLVQIQMATSAPIAAGLVSPTCAFMLAPSINLTAVLVDDVADLADVVLEHAVRRGYVIIRQPRWLVLAAFARRSSTSTLPSALLPTTTTRIPPWPRWPGWCRGPRPGSARLGPGPPRSWWYARITISPVNSPCAPEFGCSETFAKPVISQSAASSSLKTCA